MKKLALMGICAAVASGGAHAAETLLGNLVEAAGGSTQLQVNTGDSVQMTCGQLAPGFDATRQGNATSPGEDLFFRCNEMVHSALALTGAPSAGLNSLGFTSGELAQTMQQLTGEEQASKGRLATESSTGQFGNIGMRLDAIRRGARATAGGMGLAVQGMPVVGGNAGDAADGTGWSWFANGALGFGDRDATRRENEYDYDSYGGTVGIDYGFATGLVVGAAFGYTEYEVDFDRAPSSSSLTAPVSGGGIDVDGYSFSVYGITDVGPVSIDALATYGETDYENRRVVSYMGADDGSGRGQGLVVSRTMQGDTDGEHLALGLNAGTGFAFGANSLYLDVGLNYLDIEIDGYTETDPAPNGGLNLRFDDQDVESLQSRLALQLARPFSTTAGVLQPYLRAEWRHEFENDSADIVARYAAASDLGIDVPLRIATDDPEEDWVELGVGVSALFARNVQFFVDYRTSLGITDTSANLFTVGVRGAL